MTYSVQGSGQTDQPPCSLATPISVRRARQPSLALGGPVRVSEVTTVTERPPEIRHVFIVLHDNARRFGKLSCLLAVLSTAYTSALMEIPNL